MNNVLSTSHLLIDKCSAVLRVLFGKTALVSLSNVAVLAKSLRMVSASQLDVAALVKSWKTVFAFQPDVAALVKSGRMVSASQPDVAALAKSGRTVFVSRPDVVVLARSGRTVFASQPDFAPLAKFGQTVCALEVAVAAPPGPVNVAVQKLLSVEMISASVCNTENVTSSLSLMESSL